MTIPLWLKPYRDGGWERGVGPHVYLNCCHCDLPHTADRAPFRGRGQVQQGGRCLIWLVLPDEKLHSDGSSVTKGHVV